MAGGQTCEMCGAGADLSTHAATGATVCRRCLGADAKTAVTGLEALGSFGVKSSVRGFHREHASKKAFIEVQAALRGNQVTGMKASFCAEQPSWSERLGAFFGKPIPQRDQQTGDDAFDQAVFIRSGTEEPVDTWLSDAVVRAALGGVIRAGGTVDVNNARMQVHLVRAPWGEGKDAAGMAWVDEHLWLAGVLFARYATWAGVVR